MTGDSIYKPEMMAMAQKALAEEQGGPLTGIQSVQGFFPCSLFLEDGEMDEIVTSIRETQKTASSFQKKQLDQVIKHVRSPTSANLQLVFIAATGDFEKGVPDQSKLFPPPPTDGSGSGLDGATFAVCLQYPASRGHIHIKSSDPTVAPEIHPNYLGHKADVAILAAGLKFATKVAEAPSLEGKISRRLTPNPEKYSLDTKESRREAMQDQVLGEYHSCGSCAMGDTVDSRLRVKGVEGLRVADASVFANNVSGNIVSSVYMIAEKAADLIKQDWDFAALN